MAKQYRKEVGFETGSCEEDWVVVPCNERSNMFSSSVMDELVAGEDLKVEFYRPADYWTDALPVGNGRLGAMVWGGVQQELLQLNEDTLWTGEPSDYTDPRVATVLPQVRKLVTDGKFAEASTAAEAMIGQPTEVNYKTGGWVTHHVTDIWAKTSASEGNPKHAVWPMGGAWLCTHLWEHYSYTLDKSFLEQKAYPLLKGCAEFLLDWLVEYPKSVLVTNPATSPEHLFIAPDGQMASVSYATAMDMAIIKEIFIATISAAKVLGNTSDDLIQKMKAALTNLFRPKVARDGSLMEWAQDFQDPEVQHRHMSHLFGLYPGHTITMESTPELCKAAINSLFKRGEDGPGWSTVWKIALWARLHDSDHAYRMVKKLITLVNPTNEERFKGELYANLFEGGLYANLFTAHPPFQIDANFGFASAIAEILIQSDEKNLFLLPALPRDKWPSGCVSGLKARGHTNVAICWREGELHEVGLVVHNHSSPKNLHYNGMSVTVELSVGYVHTFNGDLKMVRSLPLLGIKKMSQSSCSIS